MNTSTELRSRRGTIRRSRFAPVAGMVAAASYSFFLLSPMLRPGLPSGQGFISEFEAAGQPFAWLYRLSDVVAGGGTLLLAAALWRQSWQGRQHAAGLLMLALTGSASILDGLSSMGCDPSRDARCALSDQSAGGLLGQLRDVHSQTGLFGFLGAAAGAILLGAAMYAAHPRLGIAQLTLGIAIAGCGLADLGLLLTGRDVGAVERLRTVATSSWFVCLSVVAVREERPDPVRCRPVGELA
jgi:uncharacterized protein DUF998